MYIKKYESIDVIMIYELSSTFTRILVEHLHDMRILISMRLQLIELD